MRCASLLETLTETSATPVLAAIQGRQTIKYICLGCYDKSKHDAKTEAEKQAMFDACLSTTTISAPTAIGSVENRFNLPKPP
jgi:hypothetical protein